MDTIEIHRERLAAGARYLAAIEHLGLQPDALFWAYDEADCVLVLMTPFVDHAGPLGLSEKLFAAYRAGATPSDIDPFSVRLHSPKQAFPKALKRLLSQHGWLDDGGQDAVFHRRTDPPRDKTDVVLAVDGLKLRPDWIYVFRHPKQEALALARRWKRFAANVDALAPQTRHPAVAHRM